jgi:hypothetical protein
MSANVVGKAGRIAKDTAGALCWTQWVGLGSLAVPVGSRRAHSIVDPEALVLLSLFVSKEERRLADMVAWWARTASNLTSVHRLKTVASKFPDEVSSDGLPLFSLLAAEAGDRRWRGSAGGTVPEWVRPQKGPAALELIEPSALWPRLRAGFGVGAKADALVFLLGLRGGWASAKVVAFATGYSTVAVRQAVGEMALARLIRETGGRPSEYIAPSKPWATLLGFHDCGDAGSTNVASPKWCFWADLFAFLAKVIAWSRSAESTASPPVRVVASHARDLMDAHSEAFRINDIGVPPPEAFKGRAGVEGLLETVEIVSTWAREHV